MLETIWKHELQIFEIFWLWLCETYREKLGVTSKIGTEEKIRIHFKDKFQNNSLERVKT